MLPLAMQKYEYINYFQRLDPFVRLLKQVYNIEHPFATLGHDRVDYT